PSVKKIGFGGGGVGARAEELGPVLSQSAGGQGEKESEKKEKITSHVCRRDQGSRVCLCCGRKGSRWRGRERRGRRSGWPGRGQSGRRRRAKRAHGSIRPAR